MLNILRFVRTKRRRARGGNEHSSSTLRIFAGTTASEIAEAALVFPIFFMVLLGIYWFGRAFNTYATINHAARQGARAAVAQTCAGSACGGTPNTPLTRDQIADQVKQALQASSLDPAQVINPGGTRPACGGGTASCPNIITAGEPNVCVRFNVQLQTASSLPNNSGAPACGVSVEFQYPYQFSLPFTSLNMQRILLNTGVQMEGEN
jgi:Flp pilus assembly protein TadG